jgi:UDP-N-acetylglucosamine--N-acetylmuramyl-(pentapeptide) pyrophosphoryl-undecaprenol N-acetylglucosamine transferase
VLIPDKEAEEHLVSTALELLADKQRLSGLSDHITLFAQHKSAERIVDEIVIIMEKSAGNGNK